MPLLATATLALNPLDPLDPLDPHSLPAGVGALGVFAGTDLLIGFVLPGNSLLLTARFA